MTLWKCFGSRQLDRDSNPVGGVVVSLPLVVISVLVCNLSFLFFGFASLNQWSKKELWTNENFVRAFLRGFGCRIGFGHSAVVSDGVGIVFFFDNAATKFVSPKGSWKEIVVAGSDDLCMFDRHVVKFCQVMTTTASSSFSFNCFVMRFAF